MSFTQEQYLVPIIFGIIILIIVSVRFDKIFFKWILDHWFFKRSRINIVASLFYYIGMLLLALALLDLRGPEKIITGKISDQKTIVLIDNSASMLAEDIRPSRIEKAIILAKHFVKKAVGQQISISVFSDMQKRIIPFTNDVDLLDARLNALKTMKLSRGGTGLSLAIQESIQYFRNTTEDVVGNILIFTDAEETDGGIQLDIPDGISIGVVGIGTSKGAPIPIRNKRNTFVGNKKYNGKVVITKLDENFLKKLGDNVRDYRYWIAGSYSLPTEEVVGFFSKIHKVKQSKNNIRIRPVLQYYLMIPGVILLLFSFIFKNMKSFVYVGMLFLTLNVYAQNKNAQDEKNEEKVKSQEIQSLEKKFSSGTFSLDEKRLLANKLLKEGFSEEAQALYKEILPEEISESNKNDFFNYGASQFKNKKIGEGFNTYKKLHDYIEKKQEKNEKDSEMMKAVKENMLKAIQSSAGKSGSKDDDKQDQDQNQENKNEGSSGKENQKKSKQKGKQGKDKDNKKQDEKDKNKDKNKEKDGKDGKDKNKDKEDKNRKKDKNGKNGKPKKKKKMPAILKQLMSDDNKLQRKMIDAATSKRKSRQKRDW